MRLHVTVILHGPYATTSSMIDTHDLLIRKLFQYHLALLLDTFAMSCDVFAGFTELKVSVLVSFSPLITSGISCPSCAFTFLNSSLKRSTFVCTEKSIPGSF